MLGKLPLTESDLAMFRRLRIDDELLEAAGVCRVNAHNALEDFGIKLNGSGQAGIVFPYLDPNNGNRVTCRLRRDVSGDNKAKYISPFQDNRHLYFAGPVS
jgi:hypothetical protein